MGLLYRIKILFGANQQKLDIEIHKRKQKRLILNYIERSFEKKLQIGTQGSPLPGWLNVDIVPKSEDVVYFDATKVFPLPDSSFQFIFAEHMIEHIGFNEARFMLKECYRILKPGGVIRIATPDLDKLTRMLLDKENKNNKAYFAHYYNRFFGEEYPKVPALQFNQMFYGFHHKFIHNFDSLNTILEEAGFSDVCQCNVFESAHLALQKLEQHGKMMGDDFNAMETIVVEAKKS